MFIKKEDGYWIIQSDDHIIMFHQIFRNGGGYCQFCVGEISTRDGYWDILVLEKVVARCGSQQEAVELLWEQRNLMNWGYYQ